MQRDTKGIVEGTKYQAEFSNQNLYLENQNNEKVIYDFYKKMEDANEYQSLENWLDELEIPRYDNDLKMNVYERLQYIINEKYK